MGQATPERTRVEGKVRDSHHTGGHDPWDGFLPVAPKNEVGAWESGVLARRWENYVQMQLAHRKEGDVIV